MAIKILGQATQADLVPHFASQWDAVADAVEASPEGVIEIERREQHGTPTALRRRGMKVRSVNGRTFAVRVVQ